MNAKRRLIVAATFAGYAVAFVAAATVGGLGYFHYSDPKNTCASCHEMNGMHSDWSVSAHRTLHCRNCHGGALTLDTHALLSHLRRVTQHVAGEVRDPIRLSEKDVLTVHDSCRECHPQTFADWQSSRHATNYGRIFLNPDHNKMEPPADDCLRCHGMFFAGEIRDLVAPLGQVGQFTLRDARKESHPAIPCLACHQIHTPAEGRAPAHFFDRREKEHFAVTQLPTPKIHEADGSLVKVSLDPRQRVCQQCHAPSAVSGHQRGTSDDRTPAGVHAGLSCLDCHTMHTTSALASCVTCHPANSHCGINVEKMDTTFLSSTSKHNIHTVSCTDCHAEGVPGDSRK